MRHIWGHADFFGFIWISKTAELKIFDTLGESFDASVGIDACPPAASNRAPREHHMASALQSTAFADQLPLGLVHGLSNDAYHAGPGLSHSDVKLLLRTPSHYRNRTPHEPTEAMRNGTLVHACLLEPDDVVKRYAVAPIDMARTQRVAWAAFAESKAPRIAITKAEHDAGWNQAKALATYPPVRRQLARQGEAEVSAYWIDPDTGVHCKCRPDRWCDASTSSTDAVVLMDVKTARDARRSGFAREIATYGYHTQADWYCTGWEIASGRMVLGMHFAVVENEPPHAVAAYFLSARALTIARARIRRALDTFVQCTRSGEWPREYVADSEEIDLPRWSTDE